MNDMSTGQPDSLTRVLSALVTLGEATAAVVAEQAGLAYSSTTPKLRALDDSGQAQRIRSGDGRTLWRPTGGPSTETTAAAGEDLATDVSVASSPGEAEPAEAAGDDPAATAGDQPGEQAQPTPIQPAEAVTDAEPEDDGDAVSTPDTVEDPSPGDGEPVPQAEQFPASRGQEPDQGNEQPPAPVLDIVERPTPDVATQPAEAPADERTGPEPTSSERAADREGGDRGGSRRAAGSLRGAILDILEAHPDRQYKTGELCKLIDQANDGAGSAKASPGAVFNAAIKLAAAGKAVQTVDRPATFQLASSE